MAGKLSGSAIQSGTITVTQLSGGLNDTTNAAYAQANSAYGQANAARSDANTTFATVNSTFGTINTNYQAAYAQANTARTTANDAYNAANTKVNATGGSITGDLSITGNLTVQGNATTINVSNLSVNDSIMLLATGGTGDSLDIGFIGHIQRDATDTHVGLIRKAVENQFYLFDNYEVEPTNNIINVSGNNFRLANLKLGIANANTFVTSAGLDVTGQANAAYGQANAAYGAANNRVLKAGDTMTGQLNVASDLVVTGNVGIGTTNPTPHNGSSALIVRGGSGGRGIIELWDGTAGKAVFQQVGGKTYIGNLDKGSAGGTNGDLSFLVGGDGSNATEAIVIKSDGNVGIGTTSPSQLLDVYNGNARIFRDTGTAIFTVQTTATADAGIIIKGYDAHVALGDSSNNERWYMWNDGVSSSSSLKFGSAALGTWYSDAAQVMTLTSDGKVGVGTTSPSNRLHTVGHTYSTQGYSSGAILTYTAPAGTYSVGTWYTFTAKDTIANLGLGDGMYIFRIYEDTYGAGGGNYFINYLTEPFWFYNVGSNANNRQEFRISPIRMGHAANAPANYIKIAMLEEFGGVPHKFQWSPVGANLTLDGSGGKTIVIFMYKFGGV